MTDNDNSKFKKVQLGSRRFPLPVWDKKSGKGKGGYQEQKFDHSSEYRVQSTE